MPLDKLFKVARVVPDRPPDANVRDLVAVGHRPERALADREVCGCLAGCEQWPARSRGSLVGVRLHARRYERALRPGCPASVDSGRGTTPTRQGPSALEAVDR